MSDPEPCRCSPAKRVIAGLLTIFLAAALLLAFGATAAALADREWKTALFTFVPALAGFPIVAAFGFVAVRGHEPSFLAEDA